MFDAVYVSGTVFEVGGDRRPVFKKNVRIVCSMGTGGNKEVTCVSAAYDAGTLRTAVTVKGNTLTSGLYRVAPSNSFCDTTTRSTNLCPHPHEDDDTGGVIYASSMSEAQVTLLKTIDIPIETDEGKILVVSPVFSDGIMFAELQGTAFQVIVTMVAGAPVFSLPQNIHTAATPTFAGLTLSELTGILVGKGASAVGVVGAGGALTIVRRNADNTDWECSLVNLSELGDALFTSVAAGDIVYRNAAGTKWINLAKGADGTALIIDSVTHLPVWGIPDMGIADLSDWPTDVSATELSYLNNVTGEIQSQLDDKEESDSLKLKQSISTLTDAAEITPDLLVSNNFTVTLGGDRLFHNPTNSTVGQDGMVYLVQGAGGNHEPTFEFAYRFVEAPVWSTAEGAVDAIKYWVRSSDNVVCQFFKGIGLTL